MSQTYFAILTAVGEAKLANAAALGTQLQISRMAVGDGNGVLPTPNRDQTTLIGEQYRADLNTLQPDPANASQVIAELVIPETTGGWWIREMGLYDAAGDLIAVSNCPPSYKPQMSEGSGRTQVLRMVLIVSSTAAVQLKIDPSVVLATREFVTTTVAAELAKLDTKASVRVASTVALASLSGLQTVDGVALAAGDRLLVKNQAAGATNGIYIVATGAWTRAADADASIEVTPGMLVAVEQGTINGDSVWQLITDAPISLGTTVLTFEMAAGPTGIAAGTYRSVTVNKRGHITGGTNPTTLAGYGITDAQPLSPRLSDLAANNNWGLGLTAGWVASNTIGNNVSARTAIKHGWYAVVAGALDLPPGMGSGWIFVEGSNAEGYLAQTFISNAVGRPRRFVQNCFNGTWSGWEEQLGSGAESTQAEAEEGLVGTSWMSPRRVKQAIAKLVVQATETVLGLARIATQALVNAGEDDTTIVTPKKLRWGFAISLGVNGYIVLPTWLGGLIFQWATITIGGSTAAAPWTMAFPGACLFACTGRVVSTSSAVEYAQVHEKTTTGITVVPYTSISTPTTGTLTFDYFGIGY
ncbi:phage tail protein [Stutzerimonas frequens]|uniref:phage tail-collar fiber domain-containing protein n=1 Tax=Stutzerimonas frequens TaxID=2968969 RepID=UPI00293419D7|nr:phage tail protein [Stutzerimonas frequens]WOC77640.1 phage tail protein [Stutzerimonas frequens]